MVPKKLSYFFNLTVVFLIILLLFPLQAFANSFPPGPPGESFAHLNVEGFSSAADITFTLSLSSLISEILYGCEFQIFKYNGTLEELLNEQHQIDFLIYADNTYPSDGDI